MQVTRAAALVLLYDHLVGQGVKPRGSIERKFLSCAPEFNNLQQKLLLQCPGAIKLGDLLESSKTTCQPQVRNARVNLLLTTISNIKEQLRNPSCSWASEFQRPTPEESVLVDKHLHDVLSVPANVLVHNHPLVEDGSVVLQVC